MDVFTSFLPIDRRRALLAGRDVPDRVTGTALFADISGFTPLTSKLAEELGRQLGAEELIGHLNRVYTALIEVVHIWGGDVINFSGDAITCWFSATEGEADVDVARRAAACALELQSVMYGLGAVRTPDGTTLPLSVKVALASGPARRFLVGDPSGYVIEVLAGSTLDRMAAAEKHASSGEVVLSEETVLLIDGAKEIGSWREDSEARFAVLNSVSALRPGTLAIPATVPPAVARQWILPPVYDRLRQSPDTFLSELRPSVALFLKFSGIDYDGDDEAGDKIDRFVRNAQSVLTRYEAYLLQLTVGDKGSYVYASFGAPTAHEDDVTRAAAAALELRQAAAALDYLEPVRVGISHGLVHSGTYGSPDRRTFGVIGSQVNIAARLMTFAEPGQILVAQHAANLSGKQFLFQPLPPISLKGVSKPFSVSALQGLQDNRHRAKHQVATSAMIGRERERAVLDESLATLLRGESAVLVVEGEAGIGKSLLATEMLRMAEAVSQDHTISLTGTGDAIEQATPYRAWQPVLEQVFGLESGEGGSSAAIPAQVLSRIDPSLHPFAPLLNAVLPVNIPPTDLTEQITGEARQDLTQQMILSALTRFAAGAAIILVLDDAQWVDSLSWELVRRFAIDVRPVLLMILTRPMGDDTARVLQDLRSSPRTRYLALDRLPEDAILALVSRRLDVRRLPPEVATFIYDKSEGNPFFSEELGLALRDGGILEFVDGEYRINAAAGDLSTLEFPNSIQGIITSRVDHLPPSQQLTVKVASVIGRIFAFRILRDIHPVASTDEVLRSDLDQLARLEITPLETPEPNLSYIFRHILTQEVVYSLMTFAQRRQLHREAAVWYESESASNAEPGYPLLAYHWHRAGDEEKAAENYGAAGEVAFRDFANPETIRFLSLALELGGERRPALQRARWYRLSAEAAYRLTSMEQSRADYEAALGLLGRPLPRTAVARGLGLGAQTFRQVAHRALPRRYLGSAQADQRENLLEAARTYEGVSEYFYNIGDFVTTFYCVMTAFNLAERAGPSPELARGYANMCATMATASLHRPAESYRQRAIDMAAQIDDLGSRAWIQIPLSTYSLWIGAWDRAEAEIGEALDIYAQLGEWRRWGVAAWLWPQVAFSRGDAERAGRLWAELYAVAARSRDTRHQVRSLGGQFYNMFAQGDSANALAFLDRAETILGENPEMLPVEERLWYGMQAMRALEENDSVRTHELVKQQLAAIDRARFKFDLLDVFATPVEVMLALGERNEASANDAQAGMKVLNSYARTYAFARPRALRNAGRLARLAGDQQRALKLWRKSLATAESMTMPLESKLTRQLLDRPSA